MSFIQASKQKEPEDDVNDIIKSLGKATLVSVPDGNSESDTPPEADNIPGPASPPEPASLLHSAPPKCLRFDTTESRFDNIPRYLFRISDEETSGHTCAKWVKSKDVVDYERKKAEQENHGIFYKDHIKPYEEDFFKWDRRTAAKTLNDHIRWWYMTEGRINLHSWTSSLTFALAYAIFRKKKKGRPLEKISLTVVDTKRFLPGVFIRDMELVDEFCNAIPENEYICIEEKGEPTRRRKWKDFGLSYMIDLRNNTGFGLHPEDPEHLEAYYYFGEYLSQGWLDLEGPGLAGASIILTCDTIINDNLFELDRGWQKEVDRSWCEWAMPTLRLRKSFYENKSDKNKLPISTTEREVQAVINIAKNVTNQYGEAWGLVIAANLFALHARLDYEWAIKELYEGVSGEHISYQLNRIVVMLLTKRQVWGLMFPVCKTSEKLQTKSSKSLKLRRSSPKFGSSTRLQEGLFEFAAAKHWRSFVLNQRR